MQIGAMLTRWELAGPLPRINYVYIYIYIYILQLCDKYLWSMHQVPIEGTHPTSGGKLYYLWTVVEWSY